MKWVVIYYKISFWNVSACKQGKRNNLLAHVWKKYLYACDQSVIIHFRNQGGDIVPASLDVCAVLYYKR